MKQNDTSIAIPMSFSEVAWIALLFCSFAYLANTSESRIAASPQSSVTHVKRLEQMISELKTRTEILSGSNAGLQVQNDILSRSVESLNLQLAASSRANSSISNRLASSAKEVEQLVSTNKTLISISDHFQQQSRTLKANADGLTELNREFKEEMQSLSERNQKLTDESDSLLLQNQRLAGFLSASDSEKVHEKDIRIEIAGLKGELNNVAILFDNSGSMNIQDRWPQAVNVVGTWLEYLSISNCVLITFNDEVKEYSDDGKLFSMQGPVGYQNRSRLRKELEHIKPRGGTETLSALEMAYSHSDIDTIILFTDGEPNTNSSFKQVTSDIYALARKHPHVKVNTVGLGNYFEPRLSGFLIELARLTGGGFLGR